ncbi:spindle and kinetochore-associated protein 2 isoform X2 [Ambystoma mexicanum]|uniref:spindle and kinetochore-associated protein 2 isoform X2 n=1 Tax=Ambystoma mexicanum TaxID=8296 RepID=UPI0037E8D9C4
MESAVNKLEAMFQKAESDLNYIEQKLDFEIRKSRPDGSPLQEDPVRLLEQLSAAKLRYKSLSTQLEKIAAEQKASIESIQNTLADTMTMVEQLHQQTELDCTEEQEQYQNTNAG